MLRLGKKLQVRYGKDFEVARNIFEHYLLIKIIPSNAEEK